MNTRIAVLFGAVLALSVSAMAQHAHEDMVVGRSAAGQLMIEFDDFGEEHMLGAISGVINGWLGDDPGFDHLEADEPLEDFYTLEDGAAIWFEVVSFDAGFQIWGPGFTGPFLNAGEDVYLGDDHLHEHVEFHINSDAPSFDLSNSPWEATFKLVDKGTTGYSDSPNYTLTFIPEPGSLVLLGLAALTVLRRR